MTGTATARPGPGDSLAEKAVRIMREDGPRTLWWRALATVSYRRVAVLIKEAQAGVPTVAVCGLDIARIGHGDVGEYRRLRPDTSAAEVCRRLDAGQICVLARLEGEPVASRWYSLGRAEIPYLGFAFGLPQHQAYVHDGFTAPWARRRGLSAPLRAHGEELLRELGARGFIASVMQENAPGIALTLAAGFVPAGRIAVIRLPGRRLLRGAGQLRHLGTVESLTVPWSVPPPGQRPAASPQQGDVVTARPAG